MSLARSLYMFLCLMPLAGCESGGNAPGELATPKKPPTEAEVQQMQESKERNVNELMDNLNRTSFDDRY